MIFKNLKQYNLSEERFQECDALEEQINLKSPQKHPKKEKKHRLFKTQRDFLKEDKKFFMALKAKYFQ